MKAMQLFVTLGCAILLFSGCKKSESNNSNTSAKSKTLQAGKWQISAYTATISYMGKDTTKDLYPEMDECDKDDFMQFASNGKATLDENTNKCPGDQQIETATWALLENDTKLAIVDKNPDTMDIIVLNDTQLTFKLTRPNSSGILVNYIWVHKNIK